MAALTYPVRRPPPSWPRRVDGVGPPVHRTPRSVVRPAVLLRRRLAVSAALMLVILATFVAVRVLAGLLGGAPPAPEQVPAGYQRVVPVMRTWHVVQPGDTMWQMARTIQPTGDVRPLVDRLMRARHGRPLQVGEAVALS